MPPDDMEVIRESVTVVRLAELAESGFGNLVKAVVDVDKGVMAIGGEMHADEEAVLLGQGSSQTGLWGINLYPSQYGEADWIEFDSMINIRPRPGQSLSRRRGPNHAGEDHGRRRPSGQELKVAEHALHANLAAGRWHTLTLNEQLGNVGSDVGRAIRAKAQRDDMRLQGALERALELLDLTLADERWRGPRRREIARAREVVCDFLVGDNDYASTGESLDAYFFAFAVAARHDR
jgi:hypothetical protein